MRRSRLVPVFLFFLGNGLLSVPRYSARVAPAAIDTETGRACAPVADNVSSFRQTLVRLVPLVYGTDRWQRRWALERLVATGASPGYRHLAASLGGYSALTRESFLVEVRFPALAEASTDLAQGWFFAVRTREGWLAWARYH